MSDANPYAPPEAKVADPGLQGEAAPPLWNPGPATAWSLLFTPVFGAILQMKNWQALGEPAKAARSRAWAIGSVVFTLAVGVGAAVLPVTPAIDRTLNFSGLVLLLVWYFADGREQIGHVSRRFGKSYPRRGWAIPLLIALGIFAAYLVAVTAVSVAMLAAQGEL
jgi:hypothetical protein